MEYIKFIDNLDIFQKAKVYNHYMVTVLGLRYTFAWWDEPKMKHLNPDYLHKNSHNASFEEFISPTNVKVIDVGEDWQERKFAERYITRLYGIYDWYWKFKEEL